MKKRGLFLLISFCLVLAVKDAKSQTAAKSETSAIAILLNEYSATNVNGAADVYGKTSDWVEIRNNHSTFSVSLQGYYLSNDRNNLFKWKFPSSFKLPPGGLGLVWLTGKNTVKNGEFHANFTLEQCKNQWLILSTDQGVVRDSVFIQPTKEGHTRGRIDAGIMGINAWRLYTTHSQLQSNPPSGYFRNYAPTPRLVVSSGNQTIGNDKATYGKGAFNVGQASLGYFKLEGITYDTAVAKCWLIYFTTNGDYPSASPAASTSITYFDSLSGSPKIILAQTSILRFIAVPNYTVPGCNPNEYLESFCETNTYFVNPEHQTFNPEFGVVSLAIDSKDTTWFTTGGLPKSSTVHVEYYDKMQQVCEGYGVINRPLNETWSTKQKGFYIEIDDEKGSGCNFEGPVFNVEGLGTSSRTVFPTLHLYSGDVESNSLPVFTGTASTPVGTGLRDVFIQSLAAKNKLNVNPMHVKPVNVFINAKYVGVYSLKEVYDKYYENYYNKQSVDSLDLMFFHGGVDGNISYPDGSSSQYSPVSSFSSSVYSKVVSGGLALPLNSPKYYNDLMASLDKTSFIDYMILNSFCMNQDIWDYNIAFGRGVNSSRPSTKWHYYLWNMPSIFNYTATTINKPPGNNNSSLSPCNVHTTTYPVSKYAGNSHGMILYYLFRSNTGNPGFQLEYKNRYQDLINGPLKCDNLNKHWEYVYNLYKSEMKCHTDPSCPYGNTPPYSTAVDLWDTLMYQFNAKILARCDAVANYFGKAGCYGTTGPHPITVYIEPENAGRVKLNSTVLETYPWVGNYYQTLMSFKAIPTNTTFAFDHWEFRNHTPTMPLSLDSVSVNYAGWDEIVAVFTDKSRDIVGTGEGQNVPTGFSPNGDGNNDWFRPLGSSKFANEYQLTIWSRWGEEVYRSTNPQDQGWDGNYRGQQAATGVYAYVITYRNIYGESKMLKGNVTLTR